MDIQNREKVVNYNIEDELNPHFIGYTMIIESLKNNNLFYGISKSLYLARCYTKADDVLLYKIDNNNKYHCISNTPLPKIESSYITNYLNNINSNEGIHREEQIGELELLSIKTQTSTYVLSIINNRLSKEDIPLFDKILEESFSVILDKSEKINEIRKNSEEDNLTKLGNRTAYAKAREAFNKNKEQKVTVAVMDLFRLKYVNDNIGHLAGDHYIKETANIIRKYFPKERIEFEKNGVERTVHSNDYVFRIGGDEFVIISTDKSPEIVKYLLDLVAEEVKKISFGEHEAITGINAGIISRENEETIEELFEIADERLNHDKTEMYRTLGIDRRK